MPSANDPTFSSFERVYSLKMDFSKYEVADWFLWRKSVKKFQPTQGLLDHSCANSKHLEMVTIR